MSAHPSFDERHRFISEGARRLRAGGIDDARAEARRLWGAASGQSAMADEGAAIYFDWLERRLRHEPFAHIVGRREFWSLALAVTPATLIPRPDSESLVEAARDWARANGMGRNVLDLGTGSGCLLLALMAELPYARGTGIDRSADAIAVARANALALGFADRVLFRDEDWRQTSGGPFDLIVANPPYIPSADIEGLMAEVRDFEPRGALDGGPDGLDAYRSLGPLTGTLLAPGGAAFFEIGMGQGKAVIDLMAAHGLHAIATKADLGGRLRVLGFGRS